MNTWLTKHRKPLLTWVTIVAVIGAFALFRYVEVNTATQRWEVMADFPDPQHCALCGGDISYHAPCLIVLSTGQMGELKVYTHHPSRQGEIAPGEMQQTGTFNFQSCAGLMAIRDTCTHTCKVTLPMERKLADPTLFCKKCRQLFAETGADGYAIVDLHDLNNIHVYPVHKGESKVIREYRISVIRGQGIALDVYVTGLL